jgi:molybdate transport system substrate-binding protein
MLVRWRRLIALLATTAMVVAACGDDDDAATDTSAAATTEAAATEAATGAETATTAAAEPLSGELVVFAAASLTDVFTTLGDEFMAANPDLTVTFNFAASSELATQIEEGAPADVFASADQGNMTKAVDTGAVEGEPVVFAENELQIVVEEGNPEGVTGLADLSEGDLVVALCAPEVPCGGYAAQAFEAAGLPLPEASQEQNVRAVVERIALGEADAGIGYTTDVLARADEVDGVEIPAEQNVIATYPVAQLDLGSNGDAAAAWIAYLQTPEALEVLTAAGFLAP